MATYLRDQEIFDITVTRELIEQIATDLAKRVMAMPEHETLNDNGNPDVYVVHMIRCDQKGYRVFGLPDLLAYFDQASEVERIIFTIESGASLRSNRAVGGFFDLRLDKLQTSFLTVSSDNESWMDSAFSSVKEILNKHRNRNSLVRNPWVELLIQLFGVLIGFAISLWGATKMAPALSIENAFLISFLLLLLIFSNLWAQIGQRLKALLNFVFPSIRFYRPKKDRVHWMYQTIVGGIVVAGILFLLNQLFKYIGKMLGSFV